MHYHYTEEDEEITDLIPFCSDACHKEWCEKTGETYPGWNGCQEGGDYPEWCDNCGVIAGGTYQCECQADNLVVNRFPTKEGEKCEHGNWIQLPD